MFNELRELRTSANPSQKLLSLNMEIIGLTKIVDLTRFYCIVLDCVKSSGYAITHISAGKSRREPEFAYSAFFKVSPIEHPGEINKTITRYRKLVL